MLITKLEKNLIKKMAIKLYSDNDSEIIDKEYVDILLSDFDNVEDDRFEICMILDSIYYVFSTILSEVRKKKRILLQSIFEQDKKIAEEKKSLEKKLDSYPDYAEQHYQEECLFQFLEHITNIKNNINWLLKTSSDSEGNIYE